MSAEGGEMRAGRGCLETERVEDQQTKKNGKTMTIQRVAPRRGRRLAWNWEGV